MSTARTTDDAFTHILRLGSDYTLTFRADHGRLYCDVSYAKSRYPKTYPITQDAALAHVARLSAVVSAIPMTRGTA